MRYLRLYMYLIEYILALSVLFRAFFKHKSHDASTETIVKPCNLTVQPPRDRRIEGKATQMGAYPRGVEFTFSARPYFLALVQSGAENRG